MDTLFSTYGGILFVFFRLLGVFLFLPMLSGSQVPRLIKVLTTFMLAVAAFASLPASAQTPPSGDLATIAFILFSELLIGLIVGLLAFFPLATVQLAGYVMGYQMGLGIVQAYNPDLDISSDAVSQMLFFVSIAAFFGLGGLDAAFIAILRTFDVLPVGAPTTLGAPVELFTALLSASFELALRIAAPIVGVIFLLMLAMGFIMKTMPQINVMSVGFAVKIMAGIAMLAISIFIIDTVIRDDLSATIQLMLDWAGSIGPAERGGTDGR